MSYTHNEADVTVQMTANDAPSPYAASANSEYQVATAAWHAFDHSGTAHWASAYGTGPWWLCYDFGSTLYAVNSYTLTASAATTEAPKTWKFQGSNNGIDWTDLDTQTNASAWSASETRTFSFTNTTDYRYYRVYITETQGATYASFYEVEMFESAGSIDASFSENATASDSFDSLIDELSESSTVGDTITAGFLLSSEISDAATASDVFEAFLNATDIEDNITASDSFEIGLAYTAEISDSATASDTFELFPVYPEAVEESLDFGDADEILLTMRPSISDGLDLSGISFPGWLAAVSDSIFIYDAIRNGWIVTAESTLDLADSIEIILGIVVDEWLTLIDSETNNWNGREIIDEPLTLYDISQAAKIYSDSLTDTVNFADTSLYSLSITILDYLGFTDLAAAMRTTAAAVSESLEIIDAPAWAFSLFVESALNLVDASTVITTFINTVQSDLGLADVSSLIARVSNTVTESIVFIDSVAAKGTLYNVLYDTLALNVTVELDGEIWECYVLNTPKFLPSIYSGFDFNSYCIFESRAFGANSTGIYELTGPTDAGAEIHTGAILSKTDFGSANQKKFRKGYLDISGTAPKMILETESGERQAYSIDAQGKVTASTALKSKKWTLSVAEFESLSSMKFIPIILTK